MTLPGPRVIWIFLFTALSTVFAAEPKRLDLDQADLLDVIMGAGADTTIAVGHVRFRTADGVITCDSARWVRGSAVRLVGAASIDNERYRVQADTIIYDLRADRATARGKEVRVWAKIDSLYAIGPEMLMEENQRLITLSGGPTVQLHYPDSARLVTIEAERVVYDRGTREAHASGNVDIHGTDAQSHSEFAELFSQAELVELTGKPTVTQERSRLSAEKIVLQSIKGLLTSVNLYDSATASLAQPVATDSTAVDSSRLSAGQILISLHNGKPQTVHARTQAYVWLHPHATQAGVMDVNETSGDSLLMTFARGGALEHVTVFHGAQGEYRASKLVGVVDSTHVAADDGNRRDTVLVVRTDTVKYRGDQITYAVADSEITLVRGAQVISGQVTLDAHQIVYATSRQYLKAYAASVSDTLGSAAEATPIATGLQPEAIPVRLSEKNEQLTGDYLEYSLASRKGRMVTSKSAYQTGFFYGERLYRENEREFYLDGGRYTTCSAPEPHFHFYSAHVKLKDQKRLIARPVVLYLGKLPLLAVPYWVFPLEKGRRSGILPFTLGNVESGDRFIRNVGYYWAISDYFDLLGALDYYERNRTLNLYTKFNYARRYELSGSVNANYSVVTSYDRLHGDERKSSRWTFSGTHSHQLSPGIRLSASGQAQSDRSYYTDFSTNLAERLNRTLSSRASLQWQLSRTSSLSAEVGLDDNLDTQAKSGRLPSASLSLPAFYPFGTGTTGKGNPLAGTTLTWRPSSLHSYTELPRSVYDTATKLTTQYLERKEYLRLDQQFSLSKSTQLLRYLTWSPSVSYQESEALIFRTNGADSARLEPNRWYRFYSYSLAAGMSTRLYGTMTIPQNPLGLVAVRHTLSPAISYSYTPAINRFAAVKNYIGGGPGSAVRAQSLNFSLGQSVQARVQKRGDDGFRARNISVTPKDTTYAVLDLLTLSSGFSYNLEGSARRWSNLSTTASSNLVRGLTFSANFIHSFYRPGTNELRFFSPFLTDYSIDLTTRLSGRTFLFDDLSPVAADSGRPGHATAKDGHWGLSLAYSYRENGRYSARILSSFLRISLDFLLTPTTAVTYDHYYDISGKRTVNNQVQITKGLTDCWTGNIYWIPTGSNAGYGFRIFANALPFLKLDNSQTPLSTGTFFNQR